MRGQGRVYRPKVDGRQTGVWWLDYYHGAKRHRESSRTTVRSEALRLLRRRVAEREEGRITGSGRVTVTELRGLIERQYELDGRRSLDRLRPALSRLEAFFGGSTNAIQVTPVRIDAYSAKRLSEGAARATVNYELAALRRMFRLGVKKRLLAVRPEIELPRVHNERQGFFEEGDFAALLLELPACLRELIQFARLTGWRLHKEVLPLMWEAVDWQGQVIRIAPQNTKAGDARLFPFGQAPALRRLLETRWEARDGLFVFHRGGRRILDFRGAWDNACKRAGLQGRIPHDLRRTAARDFRRAGVSEGEIMRLCGWRTRAMFDRYNIIDEADLSAAVARRFTGKVEAKSAPPLEEPKPVS